MRLREMVKAPLYSFRGAFTLHAHSGLRAELIRQHEAAKKWFVSVGLLLVCVLIPVAHVLHGFHLETPSEPLPSILKWFTIGVEAFTGSLITMLAFVAFEVFLSDRAELENTRDLPLDELGERLLASIDPVEQSLTVDLIAYSAQTYERAIWSLCSKVRVQRLPVSLKVRLLVWDCEAPSKLPIGVDKQPDDGYRDYILWRRMEYIKKIDGHLNDLRKERSDFRPNFEYKFSPFEPAFKAIIINKNRVFWTPYRIQRIDDTYPGQSKTNWDYQGDNLMLGELDANSHASRRIGEWFDTIWEHFAWRPAVVSEARQTAA